MEVDAPDVTHVDSTLSMLNMSRIHNSKSVRDVAAFDGLCFVGQVCHGELNGSVLSTKLHQVSSKPMHLVRTMQNAATKLP